MERISEDYVGFENAKLLKEKGFEGCSILTIYDENAANVYIKELREKHLPYRSDDPNLKEFHYTMPTLQMAMKWLREVHNIFISIVFCTYPTEKRVTWTPEISTFDSVFPESAIEYNSYEKACEEAIKYCLEHLI